MELVRVATLLLLQTKQAIDFGRAADNDTTADKNAIKGAVNSFHAALIGNLNLTGNKIHFVGQR